ncbi:ABC transporter permease subunit [Gryllotalpicola daejeonensis]|uniref:ABC transporter permease n=1 Tax=Gryllotalpicola daejeonensis TaxID=993087 RepID=UPI0031D0C28F
MSVQIARRGASRLNRTLLLLAVPCAVLVLVLNIYPLGSAVWESLNHGDLIGAAPFVGLRNYAYLLTFSEFWRAVLFTAVYVACGVFGGWALGLALALLLRTRVPLAGVWRALLMLPWIVPNIISLGFGWNWLMNDKGSPVLLVLRALGDTHPDVLAHPLFAQIVVCACRVWQSYPFMLLMMSSALASVDGSAYEAAQVDGAGRWKILTRITLPMISKTSYVAWILMAIFCLNDFQSIAALTGGDPQGATRTLILFAWEWGNFAHFGTGVGYATATGVLMTIVLVAVSVVLYRRTQRPGADWAVAADGVGGFTGLSGSAKGRWWRLLMIIVITVILLTPLKEVLYQFVLGGGSAAGFFANIAASFAASTLPMLERSLVLASVTIVVCLIVAAPAGYAIARGRGKLLGAIRAVIFTVQSFPVLLLLWPMFMMFYWIQLLDTFVSVQIGHIAMALGFATWMFSAFVQSLPTELEEAAWTDGCSVVGAFFRVVLPSAVPAVISTGLFVFLLSWGDWQIAGNILITNANYPLAKGDPISFVFIVLPVVLFFALNRYFSLGGVATSFSRR